MHFMPETVPPCEEMEEALCFAFLDNKLLVKELEDGVEIPSIKDLVSASIQPVRKQYLGNMDGQPCYSAELAHGMSVEGMQFHDLRQVYDLMEEELFWVAGRAVQVMNWDRNHLYCGRCGTPTKTEPDKYAKVCSQCGLISYPRISPAMIVAVTKGNQILLARNTRRPFKLYSVLAGFVEPGESLEDCVKREVREEAGIEVKNITYFGSQPWPFPDSLMIAFTAEYESGEITIDQEELSDAGWFKVDEMPPIPGSISIARRLIDWFIEKNS